MGGLDFKEKKLSLSVLSAVSKNFLCDSVESTGISSLLEAVSTAGLWPREDPLTLPGFLRIGIERRALESDLSEILNEERPLLESDAGENYRNPDSEAVDCSRTGLFLTGFSMFPLFICSIIFSWSDIGRDDSLAAGFFRLPSYAFNWAARHNPPSVAVLTSGFVVAVGREAVDGFWRRRLDMAPLGLPRAQPAFGGGGGCPNPHLF